jgi:hypothetical protein
MKWFLAARGKRSVRRPVAFRPRLEALEDRLTPSNWLGLEGTPNPIAVAPRVVPPEQVIPLVSTQATQISGTYVTGAAGKATAEGVAVGADGSVYVTGLVSDPALSPNQLGYVQKYSSTGSIVYSTVFAVFPDTDVGSTTEATSIAVDGSGNVYVSGKAHHSTDGSDNGMALKLDPTGSTGIYFFVLPGADATSPASTNGVAVDAAGDAVFVGQYSPSATEHDLSALRLDPTGALVYGFFYPFTGATGSIANAAAMPASGATTSLGGSITPTSGTPNAALLRLDSAGNPLAAGVNSSTTTDTINALAIDSAGDFFVAGTVDIGGPTQTGVAAEVDPTISNILWSTALAGTTSASLSANGISLDASGHVIVTGADASGKAYLARLSGTDGTQTDYVAFGGSGGSDVGRAVAVRPSDGHVFVVGTTNSADFPVTDGSTLNGTTDGFLPD